MTLLLLVRHALTDATGRRLSGRSPGLHLNSAGRGQSLSLVERLEGVDVDSIYSSPLERCRETAAPLAKQTALKVGRDSRLIEVDYGDWTNRSLKQLARTKLWMQVQRAPSSVTFPGGESIPDVQARMIEASTEIAAAHPDGTLALFSHGDPLRLLLAHYLGIHIDLFQRIVVSPASVSVVALGGGAPHVLRVNDDGPIRTKLRG